MNAVSHIATNTADTNLLDLAEQIHDIYAQKGSAKVMRCLVAKVADTPAVTVDDIIEKATVYLLTEDDSVALSMANDVMALLGKIDTRNDLVDPAT